GWQTAEDVQIWVAGRVVGPLPAPQPPARRLHGGQRPNAIPLDLEAVLRRIKRRRRHGQHRQHLRQHHAVLRARLRGVFCFSGTSFWLGTPTLCWSASKSDTIIRGGSHRAAGWPASLASIKAFSSWAPWSGYAVQSTLPPAASISIPARRSSSVGSCAGGRTVCGQTRTCSG